MRYRTLCAVLAALVIGLGATAQTDYLGDFNDHPGGICELWKVFDVDECVAQRRAAEKGVQDVMRLNEVASHHCQRWQKELPGALARCEEDTAKRASHVAYLRDATHVLVDQDRLVCRTERQFRETMNAIKVEKNPRPPHWRSGSCKVLDREVLVYLDAVSDDGRVAEIRYTVWNGAVPGTAYTDRQWLVTRDRYKEILEERKADRY